MANAGMIRKVMSTMTDDTLNTSVFAMQDGDQWWGDLAGHTVRLAGMNLRWYPDVLWDESDNPRPVQVATETVSAGKVSEAAARLLDLTPEEAEAVFFVDAETVDDMWSVITKVTGVTR